MCVIADHGEEFLEHGRIGHGHGLYETLLRVPWILRVPGRAAQRVATAVSLVDLCPTLLGAAGLAAPASEGVDRLRQPDLARPIFAEHKEPSAYQQSLRRDTEKLVRRFKPEHAQGPSAAPSAAPTPGTRWEAELTSHAVGDELATATARQLEARTEPASDPLGIRASSTRSRSRSLAARLAHRGHRADRAYGALPAQGSALAALTPGAGGVPQRAVVDGELIAKRIKLTYRRRGGGARHADRDRRHARERSRFVVGRVDRGRRAHAVEGPPGGGGGASVARGSREFVAAGQDAAVAAVTAQLFDLAGDPLEQQPTSATGHPLARGLDALGRDLATRRTWRAGDRLVLDEAALDSLRELGYVK